MHVVTVEFKVTASHAAAFRDAVLRQSRNSIEKKTVQTWRREEAEA
jgi:hypothetical protein